MVSVNHRNLPKWPAPKRSTYVGSVTHEDRVGVHPNGGADLVRPWRDVDDLDSMLGPYGGENNIRSCSLGIC